MTVILKVNPFQIGLSLGLSKSHSWEVAFKEANVT